MTKEESLFYEIGNGLAIAEKSQMFGKPCYKVNGKAFMCFFEGDMVFKLSGESHSTALGLPSSKQFDPSHRDRPMKEWVQVSSVNSDKWKNLARSAMDYLVTKK